MMRKTGILAAGLLCLAVEGARPQGFEQQAREIDLTAAGAAARTRQRLEASLAAAGEGRAARAGALDESKVGVAARFIPILSSQPGEGPVEFEMGSPGRQEGRGADEVRHRVRLARDFELQTTPVTQLQYYLVTGLNPSVFRKEDDCREGGFEPAPGGGLCGGHPVDSVSWDDAQAFIDRLNRLQGDCVYRLPTEAEWEYAARARMPFELPYPFGPAQSCVITGYVPPPTDWLWFRQWGQLFGREMGNPGKHHHADELAKRAWYEANSGGRTHAVATREANPLGLFDMHGNVWQWVQDWYGPYPATTETDPAGPASGSHRARRGGSWKDGAPALRSASRGLGAYPLSTGGFRLARSCR